MKRCLMTMCWLILGAIVACAQENRNVPPPPKPADDGPSLDVTVKFIQDKLNDQGPVNNAIYVHDNATGNDWTNQFKSELTKVVANPATCEITGHWKVELNGAVTVDKDFRIPLKQVADIVVMTMEQNMKTLDTAAGHPSRNAKSDPPHTGVATLIPAYFNLHPYRSNSMGSGRDVTLG